MLFLMKARPAASPDRYRDGDDVAGTVTPQESPSRVKRMNLEEGASAQTHVLSFREPASLLAAVFWQTDFSNKGTEDFSSSSY